MIDDVSDILSYDFAFQLGERFADFFHGAALGGADVDDEDAIWVLSLCSRGESGKFGVEGVDSYGGDGGCCISLGQHFAFRGRRESRDNVSALPIVLNKGMIGQGNTNPICPVQNLISALSKMRMFSGRGPHTLIPTANLRIVSGVRPITLIQSCPSMPKVQEKGL